MKKFVTTPLPNEDIVPLCTPDGMFIQVSTVIDGQKLEGALYVKPDGSIVIKEKEA